MRDLTDQRDIIELCLLRHDRYSGIGQRRFGDFLVEIVDQAIVVTWREGPSVDDVATTLDPLTPEGLVVVFHNLEPWSCGQGHTTPEAAAQHAHARGGAPCTPGAWRTCIICEGTGEMAEMTGVSCMTCDGSGVVNVADIQARTAWQSAWRVWAGRNYRADQTTDQ